MIGRAHRALRTPPRWVRGLLALAVAACLSAGPVQADPPEATAPEGGAGGSRLKWAGVRQIESVLVVVDTTRLKDARIGQVADYAAMVGLADVRLDADYGAAPTILRLFSDSPAARPDALSDWDQALLKALYTINQQSQTQLSEMRTSVIKTLSR
jgi:hypothetical protein